MKKKHLKFLKQLVETPSPTGFEEPAAALVRERLADVADEVATDTMGSVRAVLEGRDAGAPSLMLAAHMDEIGLMVTYISDEGFLSVASLGGVDAAILPGMRVDVHTASGTLRGIVGRKPIHLIEPDERKTVTPLSSLVIDLGMKPTRVKKLVRVGDPITFGVGFERFGDDMAVSKCFDDKCGVWIACRVMEKLARAGRAPGDFIAVATTQEEIGTRGAMTSAHAVNPDVALAFDVTMPRTTRASTKRSTERSSAGRARLSRGGRTSTPWCSSASWPLPRRRAFRTSWRPSRRSPVPTLGPFR